MKIDNFFTRFAKSVLGEKAYKKVLHPSKEVFLNNHLPIIESAIVTGFYMLSTQVQKDIPKENKQSSKAYKILLPIEKLFEIETKKSIRKQQHKTIYSLP